MIVIDAGFFCVAVVLTNGTVTKAAPIVRYMKNWNADAVRAYAHKRGWKIVSDT